MAEPMDPDTNLALAFRECADDGNLPIIVVAHGGWVICMFEVEAGSILRSPHEDTRKEVILRMMHEMEGKHLAG